MPAHLFQLDKKSAICSVGLPDGDSFAPVLGADYFFQDFISLPAAWSEHLSGIDPSNDDRSGRRLGLAGETLEDVVEIARNRAHCKNGRRAQNPDISTA